jgi:hypothetical protein
MTIRRALLAAVLVVSITGCSGRIASGAAQNCSEELELADAEMNRAKTDGLGQAVSIIKAASLMAAASFQKQLEKYESCADQARRARAYIADATKRSSGQGSPE